MDSFYKPNNDQPNYFGDKRLKPFINKSKNESNSCVYCGNMANTKEHLPTKGIFDSIEDLNLMILPACFSCNNSFSEAEKYFVCFIDYLKSKVYEDYEIRSKTLRTFSKYPYLKDKIESHFIEIGNGQLKVDCDWDALELVMLKIARGHMAYEFSEIFMGEPKHFNYNFIFSINNEEVENYNSPVISNVLPEIGSRMFEQQLITLEGDSVYLWKVIKENQYRYLAFCTKHRLVFAL